MSIRSANHEVTKGEGAKVQLGFCPLELLKMKFKRIISVILASALISINCISVYAAEDMTRSDWGYFWLENYCGVDVNNIKNTDYGSSFVDIAKRYGTTTLDNSIKLVQNEINDPSYDAFYDYVTTQTNNTYVTTSNLSNYLIQKGQRTVETTGKKLWDMSGSNFFNSLYNKLFNNNGYKEQYETIPGNSDDYTDNTNNVAVSVSPLGYYHYDVSNNSSRWNFQDNNGVFDEFISGSGSILSYTIDGVRKLAYPIDITSGFDNNRLNYYCCQMTVNGKQCIITSNYLGWTHISSVKTTYFNSNGNLGFYVDYFDGNNRFQRSTFVTNSVWSDDATIGDGSTTVGLPSQIGGYFDENGVWHPLYTDPSLNPDGLVINPDGTVTLPTGQDVPIYIDPNEVSPEGQNEILKYWSDTPSDLDSDGQEWKDLELEPDGDGGFKLSGLGEALSTLFEKLTEGLGDILSGLFDGIGDLFSSLAEIVGGLVELLSNIFSLEWFNDLDMSTIELPDFADLYDDLINAFGTQIGLGDLT